MNDDLRDAAFRAGLWTVIATRAKELADQAKAELGALEVGDTVAGKWDGKVLAKATRAKGRTKLVVTDQNAFINWVAGRHPTEIVSQVNPAFLKSLEQRSKDIGLGAVVSADGEVVPGVEIVEGDSYITIRKDPEAPFLVANLFSSGRLSLEGVQPEPVSRWEQDEEAGAIGGKP